MLSKFAGFAVFDSLQSSATHAQAHCRQDLFLSLEHGMIHQQVTAGIIHQVFESGH